MLIIIIFLVTLCFSLFQFYEFYKNYDYILKFTEKYGNYEYLSTPSFTYIDKSLFDPNDKIEKTEDKVRCVFLEKKWNAASKKGLITENGNVLKWNDKIGCLNYIFKNTTLLYSNICTEAARSTYCTTLNELLDSNKERKIKCENTQT